MTWTKGLFCILTLIGLSGCSPFEGSSSSAGNANASSRTDDSSEDPVEPLPGNEGFSLKTDLDFTGVSWPEGIDGNERSALQLSLNISGSFEGHDGWANLTNNFDGMGLSMGLLNQTLGTASLQPLLAGMRDQAYNEMQSTMNAAHFASLLQMLTVWEQDGVVISKPQNTGVETPLSPLDKDWQPMSTSHSKAFTKLANAEQSSVDWAIANLYNGSKFKPEWEQDLAALAQHPAYISQQIQAAVVLHWKARRYQEKLGFNDLRSYLFFFDVNVQNGGLYTTDINEYQTYINEQEAKGIFLSSKERLYKILELRIRHVKPEFEFSVQTRKSALIEGHGTVNKTQRNFENEYQVDFSFLFVDTP